MFLGDLVDRGPDTPGVLRTVMGMVASGTALCVPGNHEAKLLRALRGRDVRMSHGLAESLAQLGAEPADFSAQVAAFLDGLVSHYVLDSGRLVVAHAGLREEMHGRASAAVRAFALYGETTGETDEFGLPVRYPWAQDYRGKAAVVYGHTPGARGHLGEQHDLHRHRLRLRRPPHRAALPRAGTGLGARRGDLLPARAAADSNGAARRRQGRSSGAPASSDGLLDVADVLGRRGIATAAPRPGDRPGAERGRGAGGDEPVRGRSTVADLPPADDAARCPPAPGPACWSIRRTHWTRTGGPGWPR